MRAASFIIGLIIAASAFGAGVNNAMLGIPTGVQNATITIGNSGASSGYQLSVYGALSPTNRYNVTFFVAFAGSVTATYDFGLNLSSTGGGQPAQNIFSSVTLEDGGGTIRNFTSGSATFSHPDANSSFWQWGTGSSAAYAAGDAGENHLFSINQ